MALLIVSTLLATCIGVSRYDTETRAASEFERLALANIARNQRIALGIEERIAQGLEPEVIPPPFGSRAPHYVYVWCHPAAVLPPGPLSWMTIGRSDVHPNVYSGPYMASAATTTNPLLLRNGYFDLSSVIAHVLPIVIILLTFDLAAGGRDSGLLRLTLAQPVSFRRFLLLSSLPAAAIVLGSVVLLIGGAAVFSASPSPGRLAAWLASAVVYSVFWLALSLAINAAKPSPARAATSLFGAWLTLNVLLPAGANAIASAVYPIPSRAEYVGFERGIQEQTSGRTTDEMVRDYARRHPEYGDPADLDPLGALYLGGHAVADEREALLEAEEAELQAGRRRQGKLAAALSTLSPSALMIRFMIETAGTSDARWHDFQRQKKVHLTEFRAFFRPRIYALPSSVFGSSDYDRIPRFEYQEESPGEVGARAAVPGTFLVTLCLLAIAAAAHRLNAAR